MKRQRALFRSRVDALLCVGYGLAIIAWLGVGLLIVGASLSKGGL